MHTAYGPADPNCTREGINLFACLPDGDFDRITFISTQCSSN